MPEAIAQTFFDTVFTGSPAQVFDTACKAMMKPSEAYATPPASPASRATPYYRAMAITVQISAAGKNRRGSERRRRT